MVIDQNRLRAILEQKHAYYGKIAVRIDSRWMPGMVNLLRTQLTPEMRVLDAGCGDGSILLELSPYFHSAVGVDIDPEHLKLAEEAKNAQGVQNVEFCLMDFYQEYKRLGQETFDLVFTMRGPIEDTDKDLQTALYLLRPGGLLLCEDIAEHHQKEIDEIFFPEGASPTTRRADQYITAFERNNIDVRLVSDVFTKWIYTDVYAWFQYICNLWTWLGVPLLEPDDPRIAQFAERNTNAAGEIVTTHHVCWVAGVKPDSI